MQKRASRRGAWLFISEGNEAGRDFRLRRKLTIGANAKQCDVVLNDDAVSAQHAKVKEEGNVFVLYDLASTNGTKVNSHRVEKKFLQDDDEIEIGRTKMIFKVTAIKSI